MALHASRHRACGPATGAVRSSASVRQFVGVEQHLRRLRPCTRSVGVQPSSGALAQPSARPMVQLCSGQATLVPNTMPWRSGPPLCGQRSSSANTWSSALRNTATSTPRGARDAARAEHRDVVDAADHGPFVHAFMPPAPRVASWRRTAAGRPRPCRTRTTGRARRRGELQPLPQRLAACGVVEDLLLHVVQADAADVVHRALQVPAFLAVQLQEGAAVLQHLGGGLQLDRRTAPPRS